VNTELDEQPQEQLEGIVDHVSFHNAENGFCVLRVNTNDSAYALTVIGTILQVNVGDHIEAYGNWSTHATYGDQFKAELLHIKAPTTKAGIKKYLMSGMIKGIGAHFADKLIAAFGDQVFEVIENTPEKLLELDGIGKKRYQQLLTAWEEQRTVRHIMVFLQSHNIGTSRAASIYKAYGDEAINKITQNPYRLAKDIRSIGFKTADEVAQSIGIPEHSPLRARAGVLHTLKELASQGHCAAIRKELVDKTNELLNIPDDIINDALSHEVNNNNLIVDNFGSFPHIFLPLYYYAEQGVAQHLQRLLAVTPKWQHLDFELGLRRVAEYTGVPLSASQHEALKLAAQHNVVIITGGPGVGKTTLVNSIIHMLKGESLQIHLCAPTGRAAKRLSESTLTPAKTIHRLLEFDGQTGDFKRNAEKPLETDLLIVDEVSMVDIVLMYQLIRAIPDQAGLILVGDVDQLPSVGAGMVLADMLSNPAIPSIHLTEIFRQAQHSHIVMNAHRINKGIAPYSPDKKAPPAPITTEIKEEVADYPTSTTEKAAEPESDFYLINADNPSDILKKLLYVVSTRIPERFGYKAIEDIQVLSPMQRGELGARNLNFVLQQALNPEGQTSSKLPHFKQFKCQDKIIQMVNNYEKEVFNGDIGVIQAIDEESEELLIDFEGRDVNYGFDELDDIALAYAITIHKSQGSEYPVVVIPLATQHYMLLERNLLYTAVTRGKSLVVIIGQQKALHMAVQRQQANKRLTHLDDRLQQIFPLPS